MDEDEERKAQGGERLVSLAVGSAAAARAARQSKGGKPRIGFVNEYYANQFWRDLWGDEYHSDGE